MVGYESQDQAVVVGHRDIPMKLPRSQASTMVALDYVREGSTIEWLAGWINPVIAQQLTLVERYVLITQAQDRIRGIVERLKGG